MSDRKPAPRGRRYTRGAFALIAVLAVLAGVYVTLAPQGNGEATACAADAKTLALLDERATGEVAALAVHKSPKMASDISFIDATGAERSLSEWKGRTVLVNLWATWCVPCREEMPALDELEADLGGEDFEVVALNLDLGGPDKGKAFYEEMGLENLAYYHDAGETVFREVKAIGMPTTMLVDSTGCEVARLAGPAEWASGDAKVLLEALITP